MFFECKNAVTAVVGVEHMQWKGGSFDIAPRSYASLSFRLEGVATITAAGETYEVHRNEVLYLPQRLAYQAEYSDTEMLVIHFVTMFDDPRPEVYSTGEGEKLYSLFEGAQLFWQNKSIGFEADVLAKLYSVLGELCKSETTAQVPAHFLRAVSYIQAHYRDPGLSVDQICKTAGISATSLRQLFQLHYHKTPVAYMIALRLEYARNLISCGLPIDQAAEKSGFNDSKYFARVVKKHFHCTPRELKSYGK